MSRNPAPESGAVPRDIREEWRARKRRQRQRERCKRLVTLGVTSEAECESLLQNDSRVDSVFVQEARSYDDLIRALIRRRTDLDLSQQDVDDLAGFQSGYTGKCEKPSTSYGRIMGDMSFRTLLQTLGLKMVIVEIDPTGKLRRGIERAKVGERRRGAGKKKGKRK